jgi:hypothetical protein
MKHIMIKVELKRDDCTVRRREKKRTEDDTRSIDVWYSSETRLLLLSLFYRRLASDSCPRRVTAFRRRKINIALPSIYTIT